MEAGGGTDGTLENRLRGLILNNSAKDGDEVAIGTSVALQDLGQHATGGLMSSQQEEVDSVPIANNLSVKIEAGTTNKTPAPRKRLNQAQRRQMSAQLSIPIDTRPQPPPSARSFASSPAFPHQQHHPGGGITGHSRQQRPHSATFRPPNQLHNIPNPPLTSMPFSNQERHRQSLSLNGPLSPTGPGMDWRQRRQRPGDMRMNHHPQYDGSSPQNPRFTNGTLYQPGRQHQIPSPEELEVQCGFLEQLCSTIIAGAEIETLDILEKENFRAKIEHACREAIARYEREQNHFYQFLPESVHLKCFGSLSSGFATKAADMDLGLLSPLSRLPPDAPESPIPRIVEKAFLDLGLGARLLVRTRVPIIKVCEKPPEQLRVDLLEARERWERGVTEEMDDDETPNELSSPIEESSPNLKEKVDGRNNSHGETQGYQMKNSEDRIEETKTQISQRLVNLKQDKRTLTAYYSLAKRLLKRLGGRDITNSNCSSLTEDEFRLLNQLSLAFVHGLADEALRERLLSYRSLARYELENVSEKQRRSLHGVLLQVEGERTSILWESRTIREKDKVREDHALRVVRQWQALQDKPTFGTDPLVFNKELQVASDQLKRIPSIQIHLLSQMQFESASSYHSRAIKLLLELGGTDSAPDEGQVLAMVVRRYVSGIHLENIRKDVQAFADSQEKPTLRSVARKHKSLQLAHEFERALEKGLYNSEHVPAIQTYIQQLRQPLQRPPLATDPHFDFVVPVSAVISQIRQLVDPSQLTPNQPRDPYRDRLEFPKAGVGVQCDINFSAHLALQNTLLLRCYSHTDPRVRPMVLFIKHWAKVRAINTPYRGTLSSYGYVLMVLHYLVNVARPFVCPNLQELAPPTPPNLSPQQVEETVVCKGRDIRFWRDEDEIRRLASQNALTQNQDSLGYLLRGFFEYYAQNNYMTTRAVQNCRGFDWGRDVLSLRTHGGLLSKHEKGWTGAKTIVEVNTLAAPAPLVASHGPENSVSTSGEAGERSQAATSGQEAPDPLKSLPATGSGHQAHQSMNHITHEVKEVRHRYLFAIEDPFEHDHNVARTVTHNGIVAIRDEFRRAWRIIKGAGKDASGRENLLGDVTEAADERDRERFYELLDELHGRNVLV